MFQPGAGDELVINNHTWIIAEHPALPGSGIPYGQEGRAGIVYQLGDDSGNLRALKVFKPHYRQPYLVGLSDKLRPFAALPGLTVCDRLVLTSQQHGDLLRQDPDLLYAVIMPWIEGQTWLEFFQQHAPLSAETSLVLANALVDILVTLEQQGIAHGDLSSSNLIIRGLEADQPHVELVDVEQLYAPGLTRPDNMPGGSPGYAHHRSGERLWQADMDRFSGAVLLAEMLGSCDKRIRAAAAGETYFAEDELQQDGERYRLMHDVLVEQWGEAVATLFEQTWRSDTVAQCPPFGAWQVALPLEVVPAASVSSVVGLNEVMAAAQVAVANEDWLAAIVAYQNALRLIGPGSSLAEELPLIIAGLEKKSRAELVTTPEEASEGQKRVEVEQKSGDRRNLWLWLLPLLLLLVGGGAVYMIVRAANSGVIADITATPSPAPTDTRVVQPTSTNAAVAPTARATRTSTPRPLPTATKTRVAGALTATPKPLNKVLYLDYCDPRTDPDFCQISSSLEVLEDFYDVIDELGFVLEYALPESDGLDDYAIIIANFCGSADSYSDELEKYVASGGSVVTIADNACVMGDVYAAEFADRFTSAFGIHYSDEDLANEFHTFAVPTSNHPILAEVDSLYQYRYTILEVDSPASTVVSLMDRPVVAVYDGQQDGTIVALTSNLEWGPSPISNAKTAEELNDPGLLTHWQAIDEHTEESDNFIFWKNLLRWLNERSTMKRSTTN